MHKGRGSLNVQKVNKKMMKCCIFDTVCQKRHTRGGVASLPCPPTPYTPWGYASCFEAYFLEYMYSLSLCLRALCCKIIMLHGSHTPGGYAFSPMEHGTVDTGYPVPCTWLDITNAPCQLYMKTEHLAPPLNQGNNGNNCAKNKETLPPESLNQYFMGYAQCPNIPREIE